MKTFLVILSALGWSASGCGHSGPQLSVDNASKVVTLDTSGSSDVVFQLWNTGDQELVIRDIDSSCGCSIAAIARKRISPGMREALRVRISDRPTIGEFHATVTVVSTCRPVFCL